MAISLSVMKDRSENLLEDYKREVKQYTDKELMSEFLSYLDYEEESDSGRVFHPITISSCRVLMQQPLNEVLQEMRKRSRGM